MTGPLHDPYHDLDGAISRSMLQRFDRCSTDFFARYVAEGAHRKRPESPSPAMELGTLIHLWVLEPARAARSCRVGPDVPKYTRDWKEFVRECERDEVHPVTFRQAEACFGIQARVAEHEEASRLLLAAETEVELRASVEYESGVMEVKAKADAIYTHGDGAVSLVDLKTTRNATDPDAWARDCAKRGYHQQAGWYTWIAGQRGYDVRDFVFVVASTEQPWDVAVYRLDAAAVEAGRRQMEAALDELAALMLPHPAPFAEWLDDHHVGIHDLTLPGWALDVG